MNEYNNIQRVMCGAVIVLCTLSALSVLKILEINKKEGKSK